jgi:hypothetical protein
MVNTSDFSILSNKTKIIKNHEKDISNHFAALGTNGGPICILNNNQLANSDFISSAFPAQYGNALSGVSDLSIKLIYRINKRKFSYETGFGINNITNRKNILQESFDAQTGEIVRDYQMGLMPEGLFRLYF